MKRPKTLADIKSWQSKLAENERLRITHRGSGREVEFDRYFFGEEHENATVAAFRFAGDRGSWFETWIDEDLRFEVVHVR